jgi:hypothetical protein
MATNPALGDRCTNARTGTRVRRGREPETEYRYTLHDPWKRKLFLALWLSSGSDQVS